MADKKTRNIKICRQPGYDRKLTLEIMETRKLNKCFWMKKEEIHAGFVAEWKEAYGV